MFTPDTYLKDSDQVVFASTYPKTGHTWILLRAIDLLRRDGYTAEAAEAERFLLPLMLGSIWCDSWGMDDYDGSQILHYYCPDNAAEGYGFGSALAVFKNPSWTYAAHPFYGYGNAAEYAQNRFLAALRAYQNAWGSDPRDLMAGWVEDMKFGQNDPTDGKYAPNPAVLEQQTCFGGGLTPRQVLLDLFNNHTRRVVLFPQHTELALSTLVLPTHEVQDHSPHWLKDHLGNADDIGIFCGYDGHGRCFYGEWSDDSKSPFLFYVPANSAVHAYFLLGWSLHLVADAMLPMHTSKSSWYTFCDHNELEGLQETAIASGDTGRGIPCIRTALPVDTVAALRALLPAHDCDVLPDFKQRWYGVQDADRYVIDGATIAFRHLQHFHELGDENEEWAYVGGALVLAADLAIKATAGLLCTFIGRVNPARRWEHISRHRVGTVLAAMMGIDPRTEIFAAFTAEGGDIYHHTGGMNWSKVGGPGKCFAISGRGLYGLAPDGRSIWAYTGAGQSWTQIGGPAGAIWAGGNTLIATHPGTGDLFLYGGAPNQWTKIGGPGRQFAVDGNGRIYGLSPDYTGIYRYDGTPGHWTRIGPGARFIMAGGGVLIATGLSQAPPAPPLPPGIPTDPGAHAPIWRYDGEPGEWTKIGGPGLQFAVNGYGEIFCLARDGSAVIRYGGTPDVWAKVGDPAAALWAGSDLLFGTNPNTGELWCYHKT